VTGELSDALLRKLSDASGVALGVAEAG